MRYTEETLIPQLEEFLKNIPLTPRINASTELAKIAVEYVVQNYNTFPVFTALPPSDDEFPHYTYGNPKRKFGQSEIIEVLKTVCLAYFHLTGNKLWIGDMQLEHGGRIGTHVSHKLGLDADIDVIEVGDVPNINRPLAINTAQIFLQSGATLVFYADHNVVNTVNEWALENEIKGHLSHEPDHTKHFHLRVG
ncbi:penicillin-insensitive murein endopeptidase [Dyadobacter sp. UP-52]|uniref:Penicillin-insensitive murein endopeptidase n=2 Tax=Dyadobacter subterraneus TaxID=2773304 RepID=A0ABR9WJ41_9BACT|nr:penicillin-insensitive murein endopeptidase [Dyadobacter subterraneus]